MKNYIHVYNLRAQRAPIEHEWPLAISMVSHTINVCKYTCATLLLNYW